MPATALRLAVLAMVVGAAWPGAGIASSFTWEPSAVGLGSPGNTIGPADTIDFVRFEHLIIQPVSPTAAIFTETGAIQFTGFSLAANPAGAPGLNTDYSLYHDIFGLRHGGVPAPADQ